jgi:uncharacterized protein YjbJ (UPF0337 family)
MNKDILKGKWMQLKGKIKEEWGDITDDELDQIEGKSDQLAGKLQEKYGYTKEDAEQKIDEFVRRH